MEDSFQSFLSKIASRLRHDLKGGLITLKMGLESLSDEEGLKPLLLDKAQELVDLSDKLVLLLRMGQLERKDVQPSALFQAAAQQAENLYSPLKVKVKAERGLERWRVDPDALTFAVLELCQNAKLAGAEDVLVTVSSEGDQGTATVWDNGGGLPTDRSFDELTEVGVSGWERSGLGLAVARSCALNHGGSLTSPGEDEGTTVRITLNLEGEV